MKESLARLTADGHALYAFSNGTADAVETWLAAASILDLFDGVVSTDDRQRFKPKPDVYEHLLNTTAALASDIWLISSNPFDVIGAVSHGLRSAWVRRANKSIIPGALIRRSRSQVFANLPAALPARNDNEDKGGRQVFTS